jgi:hypothetical protein
MIRYCRKCVMPETKPRPPDEYGGQAFAAEGNSPYRRAPIEEVLDEIDMSLDEFVRVCDRFTTRSYSCATRAVNSSRIATAISRRSTTTMRTARIHTRYPRLRGLGSDHRHRLCGGIPLVTEEPADLERAARIVLPGVGAFPEAVARLRSRGLDVALTEQVIGREIQFLGICLGMQLMATRVRPVGQGTTNIWQMPLASVTHPRWLRRACFISRSKHPWKPSAISATWDSPSGGRPRQSAGSIDPRPTPLQAAAIPLGARPRCFGREAR